MKAALLSFIATLAIADSIPADAKKTFQEIVDAAGFELEAHHQQTKDGYKLTSFRIPGKKGTKLAKDLSSGKTEKPVVVMWHGLLDSCDLWAMNYANVAPAFTVAAAGYDVWLGNNRGNKYCREHVTLNPDTQPAFWDFSF